MSQAGPRTGVAVIGLGNAFIPHALALKDLAATVEVVWAASPSPARTARVAAEHGFPVTNDIQQAIADPRVFAVLLLAPPDVHLDIARSCFAAGKHVLCEKPLDVSLARAEALVAEAAHAGLTLGAVLQSRFRADALRLKQVLDAGGLGAVQAASLAVPWWRPQAYYDEPGRGTYARDGGGAQVMAFPHEMHRELIADFLAAARAGRAPAASGAELLASQAVIHAIMGRATRR